MVGKTTVNKKGSQDVVLKSTGHEKARVFVCLTAQDDCQKMKPFIFFQGAKCKVNQLNEEFRGECFVVSSESKWYDKTFKMFSALAFSKGLIVWDTFDCHMEDPVSKSL